MSVISVQNFLSAAIAGQVKPAKLDSAALAANASSGIDVPVSDTAEPLPAPTLSSISKQSISIASYTGSSISVAQLSSVLQITGGGLSNVSGLLQQLQRLAGLPAAGTEVSSATLAKIDSQFQQILAQISRIVASTTFNGVPVLDGSFSGKQLTSYNPAAQAQQPSVSLPDVSLTALFNGEQPNLLTVQAAAQAFSQVSNARESVNKSSSDLKAAQAQAEFASATLQTALSNVDASKAVITEADIESGLQNVFNQLLAEPAAAAQIQSSNLSPALLALLKE